MDYSLLPFGTRVHSQQTPIIPRRSDAGPTKVTGHNGFDPPGTTTFSGTLVGSGSAPVGDPPVLTTCCDELDALKAQSLGKNGIVMCIDGNFVLVNDQPATGGPWAPALSGNGTVTWVNLGGL